MKGRVGFLERMFVIILSRAGLMRQSSLKCYSAHCVQVAETTLCWKSFNLMWTFAKIADGTFWKKRFLA